MVRFILLLTLLMFTVGCGERKPRMTGVYTVMVGSAAIAVGYLTDEFSEQDGWVTFINKRSGVEFSIPKCQIYAIETNK